MIKELILENVEISDGEKNIVAQNMEGKILKVLFIPSGENIRLRIFTKEGEKIIDVTQKGLYYPRANVSSEKMLVNTFSHEGDDKDYYYFNKGLLFNITISNPEFEGIAISRLVLIYEETDIKVQRIQTMFLSKILQELIKYNQGDFENGRGQTRIFG